MLFGEKLKKARESSNLTIEGIAELVGVSDKTYIKYENSETTPKLITAIALSDALDVSLDYLCKDDITDINYGKPSEEARVEETKWNYLVSKDGETTDEEKSEDARVEEKSEETTDEEKSEDARVEEKSEETTDEEKVVNVLSDDATYLLLTLIRLLPKSLFEIENNAILTNLIDNVSYDLTDSELDTLSDELSNNYVVISVRLSDTDLDDKSYFVLHKNYFSEISSIPSINEKRIFVDSPNDSISVFFNFNKVFNNNFKIKKRLFSTF